MIANAKHACNYAVLRFQPYPETGEFVNLGVAVNCCGLGFLDIRMEQRKHRRVTDFFPELDKARFRAAREAVEAEFMRVKQMAVGKQDTGMIRHVFRELVRTRESIFRFGEIRTVLTHDPVVLTEKLFDQYVQRNFAKQKEYQENIMAKRYLEALREHRPDRIFRRDYTIQGSLYHVRVPICSEAENALGAPLRAIKPLDLDKPDATAIIDHGDAWITRLRRLQQMHLAPDRFIFAVNEPNRLNHDLKDAAEEVVTGLKNQGALVVNADETQKIVALAADDWY